MPESVGIQVASSIWSTSLQIHQLPLVENMAVMHYHIVVNMIDTTHWKD